jgi:abequosyltransferase
MREVRLSICIPTYNFGGFLGETLESMSVQDLAGAEIVVLDSASTDDTPHVVAEWQRRLPNLKYVRADWRGGIDRDMARVVEEAAGEYVWLFSADDVMRVGAVSTVARALSPELDVLLCSHTICNKEMRFLFDYPVIRADPGHLFDLGDVSQRHDYFRRAANTEAFFSFMSGIIVKTEIWRTVRLNEKFVGSCWAHVARFFEIIVERGLIVRYIGGPLLDKRGDNDSFATSSMSERWRLSIAGFEAIASEFFGAESPEALHVNRVLRVEFSLLSFLSLRNQLRRTGSDVEIRDLDKLFACLYRHSTSSDCVIRAVYTLLARVPIPVCNVVRRFIDLTGARGILTRRYVL